MKIETKVAVRRNDGSVGAELSGVTCSQAAAVRLDDGRVAGGVRVGVVVGGLHDAATVEEDVVGIGPVVRLGADV